MMRSPLMDLKHELRKTAEDFALHFDYQIFRLPQINVFRPPERRKTQPLGLETDETLTRLAGEIRQIGEELYGLHGRDALVWAIGDLRRRESRIVEMIWDGVGGEWFS